MNITEKFKSIFSQFEKDVSLINAGLREVPKSKSDKQEINITDKQIKSALQNIVRQKKNTDHFIKDFNHNFEKLNSSIIMCSSPKSFMTAWRLRSKELSKYDAEKIINDGGQIIPSTQRTRFRLIKPEEQGVMYNLSKSKDLIHVISHNEGNYDDHLDDLGVFKYQPPVNVSGMLKYRWCQFLSKHLKVDFIVIARMWFQYKYFDEWTLGFILAPAKIIQFEDDLKDLNTSLHNPLTLQIITREEALSSCHKLLSLDVDTFDIPIRTDLEDTKALEWSYDKLSTPGKTSKGTKIKKWAQKNNKKCLDGRKCNNILFKDLKTSEIAFGHVISQKWCDAFGFLRRKKHHPDNLYLTCNKCNSSLSDNFPGSKLQKTISNEEGTIGDWLRNSEEDINNMGKKPSE